ncbi:galactose oxidase [Paludisphaera borealis]|uniref:N-acetylneuraminate epimerase n=1 Tax=Paludisphaera borealis TaxID=1387353 RepID=A0A1U7CW08_9BACT|nr:galactose oxidase [Paludisphaera borealis]APW63115.1 N-acetylneuraminate epimerase [Paludisphaera borealis]
MTSVRSKALLGAALATALILPQAAWAHFIWIKVESAGKAGESKIQAFFNEDPEPDSKFVKYVTDLRITVDGQTTPSELTEATRDAYWAGNPPTLVDAERDLGVKTKGDKTYHLYYTARAQTEPVGEKVKEHGDKLRVRLVKTDGKPQIEVLFNGKPVDKARIKVYPAAGESTELPTDEKGRAVVENFEQGKTALWANFIDRTPGEKDGKAYAETRYYATLTFTPAEKALGGQSAVKATTFATIPAPAVNSFGGAVLGKWLYVYGGHVGKTHSYSEETTAKHFRRLNLEDRKTWEELPLQQDLQGLALVSDGKSLYRIGGMVAKNKTGEEHDLHSVADFSRFDPETKSWTALAPLPEPRSTHDAIVVGRTVYVAGGWHMKGESDESVFLDSAVAFNLDKPEDGWKTIAQPFKRRALSVASHGGRLYVLGGLVGGGMTVDRRVDVYDPASGAWSRGPELPGGGRTEGFGTSAFDIAGRLYYSGSSGRIYRLDDAGDKWEAVGAWALPRLTHRLLPGPDDSILAVGGASKASSQTAEIEIVHVRTPVKPTTASAGE